MGARNHMLIKFGTLSQRSLTFVQRKLAMTLGHPLRTLQSTFVHKSPCSLANYVLKGYIKLHSSELLSPLRVPLHQSLYS